MKEESKFITTNLSVIESIVSESQDLMNSYLDEGRTSKEGGGFILKCDPNYKSLKEALKVIVFVGMALESMWHQKAVELKSKTFAEKIDRECKSVPEKYKRIGISKEEIISSMSNYYKVRRQIVHEKSYDPKFQTSFYTAEDEANAAVELLKSVKRELARFNTEKGKSV